jgi:peptidoglycan L-alanyl-D-glutamate endopeptidase CwlK
MLSLKKKETKMPRFSKRSLDNLATCSSLLQLIAKEAIEYTDFSVIWGHRSKEKQDMFFREGYSDLKWPFSKHNKVPSEAFDIVPWPINWDDRERFFFLAGVVLSIAKRREISLRWGGAWDGSFNVKGQRDDLAHFELY